MLDVLRRKSATLTEVAKNVRALERSALAPRGDPARTSPDPEHETYDALEPQLVRRWMRSLGCLTDLGRSAPVDHFPKTRSKLLIPLRSARGLFHLWWPAVGHSLTVAARSHYKYAALENRAATVRKEFVGLNSRNPQNG